MKPLLGEEKSVKKITLQEQAPLHLFSACWERKKSCWSSFLRLKGYFFPSTSNTSQEVQLLFTRLSMLFITLNVATFFWVVLSNLQFSPSNRAFYWYALKHIYTTSKCHQHTHGPGIQYASPYLSLTWCLPSWFASGFAHLRCLHQNQPFSSLNCSHHCSLVFWRFCSLEVSLENDIHVSTLVHWKERKIMLLHGAFSPFKLHPPLFPIFILQKRNGHAAGWALVEFIYNTWKAGCLRIEELPTYFISTLWLPAAGSTLTFIFGVLWHLAHSLKH